MADNLYQLAGKVNIPTEKKNEMNKRVLEIMDKCGIRKTIEMETAGEKVMAVSPVQPDENGIVMFDYSVFEKRKREISTYDMNTCELHVEDGGYREFEIVMNMIMVLLEAYTSGGCYFVKSGRLCDAGGYLAVLQGVLGERITLPGRTGMWEMYLFFRDSEEYQNITYEDLLNDYSTVYGELNMEQLLAVFEVDRNELTFPEKEHISCRDDINTANHCSREEYAYRIFCSMDEDEKSIMKELLTELLNSEFDRRKKLSMRQDKKGIIAELSLYVLPSCLTLAYAKAVEKDFWEIWDSFGTLGYADIIQKNDPEEVEADFHKLPFYRAIQRKDEDEFLEFWDGSNLILSQNMKKCVQEWQECFRGICIPSRFSMEHLLANWILGGNMGTFACYTGEMNIEEEKRASFGKQMIKLLNYGGMMRFEKVSLYGYELYLLSPAELSQEGEADFWYNYFEDSSWEDAGFNAKSSEFYSNKIGGCEFCDVILAAYMLYEMYDETPGFAEVNGDIVDAQFYGGWINHILGTEFSMKKRYNLWKNAEHIAFSRLEYCEPFTRTQLRCLIPDYLLKAAGGTELSDLFYIIYGTGSLEADQIIPSSYPEDVYQCKKALVSLREVCGENFLEYLLQFLKMGRNTRGSVSDIKLTELAKLSLVLPARVLVYLAAEIENESFWKLWKEWRDEVYRDEQMKQYASEELQIQRKEWKERIIPEIRTSDFLRQDGVFTFYDTPDELKGKGNYYLTDDDRIFWWDGTDEVVISDEMNSWLEELADQHGKLMDLPDAGCGDTFKGEDFIKDFMILLDEICDRYKRIFPFKTMFYDFIQNSEKKEYRAAIALLKKLDEENREEGKIINYTKWDWSMTSKNVTQNIARLRLKRYMSVMANKKVRKKYFKF